MFSKRCVFSCLSSVSVVGSVLTLAPCAFAACPEPEPPLPSYVAARAPKNVCTAADLAAFESAFNADGTWADLEAAVTKQSAACSACIFSKEGDSAWGPIVKTGTDAFANWGACYEKAAGGSVACGAAFSRFDSCSAMRCSSGLGFCATQTALDTCLDDVAADKASCGQYDYVNACPNLDALDAACDDIFGVIEVMCGGGAGDAGVVHEDGGTADAGKADGGTKKKSASPTRDSSKKKSSSKPKEADDAADSAQESGCAQSGGSPSGSLASALLLMCAVGGAIRSRRRSKRESS